MNEVSEQVRKLHLVCDMFHYKEYEKLDPNKFIWAS